MINEIKLIEDISLNAWPSYQMQLYDGWILRYSDFYTHRTNCVEEIAMSTIPWEEKIAYCETIYKRWKTSCIFKITPLQTILLDNFLEEHQYQIEHTTHVMVCSLTEQRDTATKYTVRLEPCISQEWISNLFLLKNLQNKNHQQIVPTMYGAIPKDVIALSVTDGNQLVGIGLGILDRNYIGLYSIHVETSYRTQGIGSFICSTLMNEGYKAGANRAYLQVVEGNTFAKQLYHKLGFQKLYTYWFRTK